MDALVGSLEKRQQILAKEEPSHQLRRKLFLQGKLDRGNAFKSQEAKALLEVIPTHIRKLLVDCVRRFDLKSDKAWHVREYFYNHSDMPSVVNRDSTSAITFEWLYRLREPKTPIDVYFTQSESGRQILARMTALVNYFPDRIRHEYEGRKLTLINVGSGPGHEFINILNDNPDLRKMVRVRNLDRDEQSLAIGRERTEALGIADSFSFEVADFTRVDIVGADMVSAIGIFCPVPRRASVKLLRGMGGVIKPGGIVVYSTAQMRMQRDPLCDYVMRLFGWKMFHRTDEEAWSLATAAGLEPSYQFFDKPHRHHCMTVACRPAE